MFSLLASCQEYGLRKGLIGVITMPFQDWKQVVGAAALGDEEATTLMAEALEGRAVQKRQGMTAVEEYNGLLAKYRDSHPDIFADEGAAKEVNAVWQRLRQNHSEMTLTDAFETVVDRVTRKLGPGETRDYSSAIENMRRVRTQGRNAPQETDEYLQLEDPQEAQLNFERSMDIRAMAEARKPKANPFVDTAALEQASKALDRARGIDRSQRYE
jgi:hypothetical protein